MRKRNSRYLVVSGMILSGAYLFAGGSMSCGSLAGEAGVAAVDMCFIFDCTNGAFGGLIDPCGTVPGTDTNAGAGGGQGTGFVGPSSGPLFADCPVEETAGGA